MGSEHDKRCKFTKILYNKQKFLRNIMPISLKGQRLLTQTILFHFHPLPPPDMHDLFHKCLWCLKEAITVEKSLKFYTGSILLAVCWGFERRGLSTTAPAGNKAIKSV